MRRIFSSRCCWASPGIIDQIVNSTEEEADQLCDRVAIIDHGKILALDTPAALRRSVGADTIVTVKATGDPTELASTFERELNGVTGSMLGRVMDDGQVVGMRPGFAVRRDRWGDHCGSWRCALAAGAFNACLFAPLFGLDLMGRKRAAS